MGGVKRRFGLKIRTFAPFFCGQSGAKPHIRPVQEFVAKSITHQSCRTLCNIMKINELRIKNQESLICFQKKSCLLSKEALFTTQRSLVYNAKKPLLQHKQDSFVNSDYSS